VKKEEIITGLGGGALASSGNPIRRSITAMAWNNPPTPRRYTIGHTPG
jgi:hypothetical protein